MGLFIDQHKSEAQNLSILIGPFVHIRRNIQVKLVLGAMTVTDVKYIEDGEGHVQRGPPAARSGKRKFSRRHRRRLGTGAAVEEEVEEVPFPESHLRFSGEAVTTFSSPTAAITKFGNSIALQLPRIVPGQTEILRIQIRIGAGKGWEAWIEKNNSEGRMKLNIFSFFWL